MDRTVAMTWVLSVCSTLRLSQSKTLSELVAAAMGVGRISLAEIGRRLGGSELAKHRIKRTWRFVANQRVLVSDAMQGLVQRLARRYQKLQRKGRRRRPKLLIAFDWVEIRNFHTLMAAAVQAGRAVPLLWATYSEWKLRRSQNNLEEGLLRLLRTMIPEDVEVVLLADRGFGRTELARLCQHLRFHYVVRITPDAWIESPHYSGTLARYPVKKGLHRLLTNVRYRKKDPVVQHVAVCWKVGLPKKRDEPWFLMTDLERKVEDLTTLYGKRMTIEELFRDNKNKRNGWSLRHTKIKKPERLDRLLLILALAYWLLVGLGTVARQQHRPALWCSSNRQKECSAFTIGRKLLERLEVPPATAFAALVEALLEASRKWG
jgi:predicted nucleic acid-binding protein